MNEIAEHSVIACSAAGIWGKPDGCTGYPGMVALYPETEDSEESREGTAVHEIGEVLTEARTRSIRLHSDQFIGKTATNGVVFNDEMFEAAQMYANDIAEVMVKTRVFGGRNFGTEQRIIAKAVHDLSYGRCDQFIYAKAFNALYIWDFKFGYGAIEAYENYSLINYFSGIMDYLELNGIDDQYLTVHFRIVQPRARHREGPIREWVVKASDLRAYVNILSANAHKSLSSDAECRSGSHCKDCSARHACDAAINGGVRLYEAASAPVPVELSPVALGTQLIIIRRALKQLEYLDKGYSAQVESIVKSGGNVPGFVAEPSYGNLAWDVSAKEVAALGDMLGQELRKPLAVKTPTQAKASGIDVNIIKEYSKKSRTGIKIVPDDKNRAKRLFSL